MVSSGQLFIPYSVADGESLHALSMNLVAADVSRRILPGVEISAD
jgi:hypothetical protein